MDSRYNRLSQNEVEMTDFTEDKTLSDIAHKQIENKEKRITIILAVIFSVVFIFGMVVAAGCMFLTIEYPACRHQKENLEEESYDVLYTYKTRSNELKDCIKHCNTTSCSSCCSGCDGEPAPIPPFHGHPDQADVFSDKDCGGVYAKFKNGGIPTNLCRLGSFDSYICGFKNDETISVLEEPVTGSPSFGEGTIISSFPVDDMINGRLCKKHNGVLSAPGLTRFFVRGDQTGYEISFVREVLADYTSCNLVSC